MKNQVPKLPNKYNFKLQSTPILDQGKLGSSTACAMASVVSSIINRGGKWKYKPSDLFKYYKSVEKW
jgi:hypothetical protein